MTEQFKITVCSLPEYEELVAEIYIDERFVGLLSQEKGADRTVFEFGAEPIKADLWVFESALAAAKLRLFDLRKNPPLASS